MTRDFPAATASVFRGAAPLTAALLAIALAACSGDDDGGPSSDAGDDGGADAAPGADASTDRATEFVANPAGTIQILEGYVGEIGIAAFASLRDRAEAPVATLAASEGECEIWTHPTERFDCDPPCEGACVADDTCEPFPVPQSAGEIAVSGLAEELRFVPSEFGYRTEPDVLPEDMFEAAAAIEATAPGGDAPGFTLSAEGVAPLEPDLDLDFDVTLVIEDGVDEVIRWVPESSGRVQLGLQVGWHGAAYEALLLCEADDAAGQLTVPGKLIERFPERVNPTGEAHSSWIARFDRDVVEGPAGPIELFVASRAIILQIEHR